MTATSPHGDRETNGQAHKQKAPTNVWSVGAAIFLIPKLDY